MANTGFITKEQLTYVTAQVYQPNAATLTGRSLFSSEQTSNQWDRWYKYMSISGTAVAGDYSNRATSIPVVDASAQEDEAYITGYNLGADYSQEELEESQLQNNFNLLTEKAQLVARGMAEKEDRIIFNGRANSDPKKNILGITAPADQLGIQSLAAPDTFNNLSTSDSSGHNNNLKIRNYLEDALSLITRLSGYDNARPVLALPKAEYDMMRRAFNDYNPNDTVLSQISSDFSQIVQVPEFEAKYWGAKSNTQDMGMIFMNTPREAVIADAMRLRQMRPFTNEAGVTKVWYLSRHSGVIIKYPSAFVRLDGIGTRTYKKDASGREVATVK